MRWDGKFLSYHLSHLSHLFRWSNPDNGGRLLSMWYEMKDEMKDEINKLPSLIYDQPSHQPSLLSHLNFRYGISFINLINCSSTIYLLRWHITSWHGRLWDEYLSHNLPCHNLSHNLPSSYDMIDIGEGSSPHLSPISSSLSKYICLIIYHLMMMWL